MSLNKKRALVGSSVVAGFVLARVAYFVEFSGGGQVVPSATRAADNNRSTFGTAYRTSARTALSIFKQERSVE